MSTKLTPKITNKYTLPEHDQNLIHAFIVREAVDYGGRKDATWIEAAFNQVLNRIHQSKTAIFISISSLGNAGAATRNLTIDINNSKAWDNYDTSTRIKINLCPCGQLNHLLHSAEELNKKT